MGTAPVPDPTTFRGWMILTMWRHLEVFVAGTSRRAFFMTETLPCLNRWSFLRVDAHGELPIPNPSIDLR